MFKFLLKRNLYVYQRMLYHLSSRRRAKTFSSTLNLPKTTFPLSMKDGIVPQRELDIQKATNFEDLYQWQQSQKDRKLFILHDGPPYANGDTHVGHALNKITKDIVNRYKMLRGYKVHYVPGWDCHGTPIEQKALADIRQDQKQLHPLEIREKALKFAKRAIQRQKKAFKRWGVMADWDQCYVTYDKAFIRDQLEVFYKLFEEGLIYQDYMPVFWSPSSRSALAEAELEYNERHVSTAVYVKLRVVSLPHSLQRHLQPRDRGRLAVWTTTPWTLPLNAAVCYGPGIKYCLAKRLSTNEVFVISVDFMEKFIQMIDDKVSILATFHGTELEGSTYEHPLFRDRVCPVLPAPHVTTDKGTGLVHTAPAHGPEDFQVALRHGMPVECAVDEDGLYTDVLPAPLAGKLVTQEGNALALEAVSGLTLHREMYEHSYPYDWRTKTPVILRASKQWFVNASRIKQDAISCLERVSVVPSRSTAGLTSQLAARTYWCVSRQRAWGVPIPVFYNTSTGQPLLSRASVSHVQTLLEQHGADAWWTLPTAQLLPTNVIEQSGHDPNSTFERGTDVLDIWFDSGSTWAHVLKDVGGVADVYLEGVDQFGGWFQSSLLTSVGAAGRAPYKLLVVHGFTVDEQGKKMSKSVGNVVNPYDIINGGKDRSREPAYGADVLRWWVGQAGLDPLVQIGPAILDRCNQQVFKLRKSLRYLMGNLFDYDHATQEVAYDDLPTPDKYMLHLLYNFIVQVQTAYDSYNFSRVLQLLEKFNNGSVSRDYCHVTKHRLYCKHASDRGRVACQTVTYHLLSWLTKVAAPVLPHLAEEAYQHHPLCNNTDGGVTSVFRDTLWAPPPCAWYNADIAVTMELASAVRDTLFSAIAATNPVTYDVVLICTGALNDRMQSLHGDGSALTSSESSLNELLQTSSVTLLSAPPDCEPGDEALTVDSSLDHNGLEVRHPYRVIILPADKALCKRCRRHTADTPNTPCDECMEVLSTGWES